MLKILVNGKAAAGKDTFVDFCIAEFALNGVHAKKSSSVDGVKNAAHILGWDGVKDAKGRKFLSALKDLSTEYYDGPMQHMEAIMKETTAKVIFFFIREPTEIERFVRKYPDTKTFLLIRSGTQDYDNHADTNVSNYSYDCVLYNDYGIYDLQSEAMMYVEKILLEEPLYEYK